jgi:hypothetical protein
MASHKLFYSSSASVFGLVRVWDFFFFWAVLFFPWGFLLAVGRARDSKGCRFSGREFVVPFPFPFLCAFDDFFLLSSSCHGFMARSVFFFF